ncbi:MAG: hypothetical protein A2827_01540 [Candidatus Spechtbacteria bacterium RIFCSPHIGHO2_01_FULL_43_30]|uniref:Uncharacterized protein n=1 Tax=Candidatus Spechtbacteria bacterium RIFCSPHIGHO2_01_FULL_43_30 TaxID=1802158 RepID=A0A1G2H5Q0_9BACT|nr:MAG: hypothetical protein A2827_01540 [Candidatus Spechtbacteria bacterium RIFCSPHIGHO2_01_FULL_43_30]
MTKREFGLVAVIWLIIWFWLGGLILPLWEQPEEYSLVMNETAVILMSERPLAFSNNGKYDYMDTGDTCTLRQGHGKVKVMDEKDNRLLVHYIFDEKQGHFDFCPAGIFFLTDKEGFRGITDWKWGGDSRLAPVPAPTRVPPTPIFVPLP